MKLCDVPALALDLLLPPRCVWCGRLVARNGLCLSCASALASVRFEGTVCRAERSAGRSCANLDAVTAAFRYGSVAAEGIKRYKFKRYYACTPVFAREIVRAISEGLGCSVLADVVTCVPEHGARRGMKHSEKLAESVANMLGLPFDAKLLRKIRTSDIQHTLDLNHRACNLAGAFEAPLRAAGMRVIIVDDIVTSGHTLNECAAALKRAGALRVTGAVLCSAM